VMAIHFLIDLVSSQFYLLGVDHHHVIPAIEIRREIRLVLADQDPRDARRQAPEHLSLRVHHEPVFPNRKAFRFPALRYMRPHLSSHTFPSRDKPQV
jgi:hypothetical protein